MKSNRTTRIFLVKRLFMDYIDGDNNDLSSRKES